MSPTLRARLYETGLAAAALAVGYGLISQEHALLWAALLTPWLGLARANTPS